MAVPNVDHTRPRPERRAERDNPSRRVYEAAGFNRCDTKAGSWAMRVAL